MQQHRWHSFRNNSQNTGCTSVHLSASANINKNARVSSVYLGGLIWGTPIASSTNIIYVGSTNKRVYAIDSKDRRIIWSYRIQNRADSLIDSACSLSPDETQLIVPGGDGFLHSLDAKTGELQWTFHAHGASDATHTSGVIVNSFEGNAKHSPDGKYVYAGNDNAYFYCIDAATGKEIWAHKTNMMIWTVPAFTTDYSSIIFGSLDGFLYVLNSKTGEFIAKYNTKGEIKASPVIRNDRIFVANSNGDIVCLQFSDSAINRIWHHSLHAEIYASPALKDDHLIAVTMEGQIVSLSADTGKLRWSSSLIEYSTSSPIITADDVVIVGNSIGRLAAFDISNGKLIACAKISDGGKNINSSPIQLGDGSIVAGSYDGNLYIVPPNIILSARDSLSNITLNHTHLQEISSPDSFIKSYRLNAFSTRKKGDMIQSAAVNKSKLRVKVLTANPDFHLPYHVQVCPDGSIINLIPKSDNIMHPAIRVRIAGTYYLQTNSWLTDRFVFRDSGSFSQEFTIPERTSDPTNTVDFSVMRFDISKMAVTQPVILDTYIPAAMDGQGFVAYFMNYKPDQKTFVALFIPAIPDEQEPFAVLPEPDKVLLMDGTIHGSDIVTLKSRSNFTFSAMGGTITFSEFKIFARATRTGLESIEFYARASCLKIKGNGESYQFSTDIVNQLCDFSLNTHVIGKAFARPNKDIAFDSRYYNTSLLLTHYDLQTDSISSQNIHPNIFTTHPNSPHIIKTAYVFANDKLYAIPSQMPRSHYDSVPSSDGWFVKNAFPPIIQWACSSDVHPNVVTISSIVTTIAMLFIKRKPYAFIAIPILMMYKWFADAIDGPIARACKKTSKLGGALDAFADFTFMAVSYILFMNMLYPKRSALRVYVEAIAFGAFPWILIAIQNGLAAIASHSDFKNSDTSLNLFMWIATENTFFIILITSIVYAYIRSRLKIKPQTILPLKY